MCIYASLGCGYDAVRLLGNKCSFARCGGSGIQWESNTTKDSNLVSKVSWDVVGGVDAVTSVRGYCL